MEDNTPLISIIIPLYNSEKYIEAALDSILDSDLDKSDYEIIVVNDGSTDKGPVIAQRYAANVDNIIYLSQENQGQSVARNKGMSMCHGDYFWCVDADDTLEPNLLPIVEILRQNPGLDILAVLEQKVTEKHEFVSTHCYHSTVTYKEVISGRDAMVQGYSPSSACALIVKTQMVKDHQVFFVPGITHQDAEWTCRLMPMANRVYFSDIVAYNYIWHDDSVTHSIKPEKKLKYVLDDIFIIKSFTANAEKYADVEPELSKVILARVKNNQIGLVLSLFKNRKQWKEIGIFDKIVTEFRKSGIIPLKGSYGSLKKNIAKIVLNIWCYFKTNRG